MRDLARALEGERSTQTSTHARESSEAYFLPPRRDMSADGETLVRSLCLFSFFRIKDLSYDHLRLDQAGCFQPSSLVQRGSPKEEARGRVGERA